MADGHWTSSLGNPTSLTECLIAHRRLPRMGSIPCNSGQGCLEWAAVMPTTRHGESPAWPSAH